MIGMKVSVNLPGGGVAFVDEYARAHACASRSAVVRMATDALRPGGLREAYGDSWAEWEASGEADVWGSVVGDGESLDVESSNT